MTSGGIVFSPKSRWFHGGIRGLSVGDVLEPSPPHVTDGCPVCVARADGRVLSVGEFREWLGQFGDRARAALDVVKDRADYEPLDPPSDEIGVYITTHQGYATWYAALRGHGDLYEVRPLGELILSDTDHFPTAIVPTARVVGVPRRAVRLTRPERRTLDREWKKRERGPIREAPATKGVTK